MRRIRTLIVDDEPLAREGLELMARADPEIEIVGLCADGAQALARIRELRPDLVFLDVQMPLLDGFQVLAALPAAERPCVVFITAYEQHAIRAFEVSAIDYLLKPFGDARFAAALARAKLAVQRPPVQLTRQVEELLEYVRRFESASATPPPASLPDSTGPAERIVLKADGALHFIKADELVWLEAQGDFVKVQTIAGKPQMVRETLQAIEVKLDPRKFLRIHRSYVVNVEHVRRVESALYGDYAVFMSDGTKLRLSRSYRTKLKALVKSGPSL